MSMVIKSSNMSAVASGTFTTVTASDNVPTGLREVQFALVSLSSDPIAAAASATVTIPDQVSGPGNITVKTWTSTQTAGTTFAKTVSWMAWGR